MRDRQFVVAVTAAEHSVISGAAARRGLAPSAWLRTAGLQASARDDLPEQASGEIGARRESSPGSEEVIGRARAIFGAEFDRPWRGDRRGYRGEWAASRDLLEMIAVAAEGRPEIIRRTFECSPFLFSSVQISLCWGDERCRDRWLRLAIRAAVQQARVDRPGCVPGDRTGADPSDIP